MDTPTKKKVLFIVTQGVMGGAQKYVLDLAFGLKNNYQTMIASGLGASALQQAATNLDIPYYPLTHLKREIKPFRDLLAVFEIAGLVKKLQPDIVHLNSSKAMVVGGFAAKLAGANAVISTMHGLVLTEPLVWPQKLLYFVAEKLAAPCQDAIIAVCHADRLAALQYGLKRADKIFTIHNGIALDKLRFLPREQARRELQTCLPQILSEKKIIMALSDHYPVKGLEYLARACAEIRHVEKILVINLGRTGPATEKLQKLIAHLHLQNVFLTLDIPEPVKFLKAADVFVLPSLKEGLPYALLTSVAAEIPIVASSVGGIPDVIQHEVSGLLVPPGDSQKLAAAICRLLADKILTQRLATAVKRTAQKFTLEKMLEQTRSLYEKLIAEHSRA